MLLSEFILSFLEGRQTNLRALRHATSHDFYFNDERKVDSKNVKKVFNTTISRLKRQGFIKSSSSGALTVLERGRKHLAKLKTRRSLPKHHVRNNKSKTARDTIIIFDIPEKLKNNREWLRIELVALGFEMLQKSAWIGSGPLPEEFLGNLRELNIFDCIHIFSIQRHGTIKK